MRRFLLSLLAFLIGAAAAIVMWMLAVLMLGSASLRMGGLVAVLWAGLSAWVGIRVWDRLKVKFVGESKAAPERETPEWLESPGDSNPSPDEADVSASESVRPAVAGSQPARAVRSPRMVPVRTVGYAVLVFLAGLAVGYGVRDRVIPEKAPTTVEECAVAIANAQTEQGAKHMSAYCHRLGILRPPAK